MDSFRSPLYGPARPMTRFDYAPARSCARSAVSLVASKVTACSMNSIASHGRQHLSRSVRHFRQRQRHRDLAGREGHGSISISFTSKQTGRWGAIRIPSSAVAWADTYSEAWRAKDEEAPPFGPK
jgi:hypothetical protein